VGCVLAQAAAAQAFTLINPKAAVTVSPTAGLKSAALTAHGTYAFPCPSPAPTLVFSLYWDLNTYLMSSTTVTTCSAGLYDAGVSPGYVPDPSDNAVGSHNVILVVTDTTGATMPNGTATAAYLIKAPPPPSPAASPKATPRPSPRPTPTPSRIPSPKPTPSPPVCPVASNLPPPGSGGFVDTFIAGAMVAAVLPILGLALYGPTQLFAALGRRRRILGLLGVGMLLAATLSCTSTAAQPGQTPVAAVSPSSQPAPSPSPSPTC
jgi:hypothetical protein